MAIVFCETRQLAEEWTYRYLAAAHTWASTEAAAIARISRPTPPPNRPSQHRPTRPLESYALGRVPTESPCPTADGYDPKSSPRLARR